MMRRLKITADRLLLVQANVMLGFLYIVVVPFFWLIHKMHKAPINGGWHTWRMHANTLEECRGE